MPINVFMCRYDGIGRLGGFKTRCLERVGSTPTTDTNIQNEV